MKVLITGPESSGKSTLARTLAWALDGIYVAERSRAYLHTKPEGKYTAADLPIIWAWQARAEETAAILSPDYLLCDTGPEVIRVWSEVKFGNCDPVVLRESQVRSYDLTLLCTPDLPWVADPLREASTQSVRDALFERYRELLPAATVISGNARTEMALNTIFSHQQKTAGDANVTGG